MVQLFLNIIILAEVTTSTHLDIPGYFKWSHDSVASQFLYCKNCCQEEDVCTRPHFNTEPITICCTRRSKPLWNFPEYENLTEQLSLKYTDSFGHGSIISRPQKRLNYSVLDSYNGNMSSFPENICRYPNLVEIKIVNHKLEKITDLSCLKILDTLYLDYNYIKYVSASTFSQLPCLRFLSLSYNMITYIEPGTFKYTPRSLSHIYLDNNQLKSIDVSNLVLCYFFQIIDLSNNSISIATNKLNWTGFLPDQPIGGGTIKLNYNNLSTIPLLSELGFPDIFSVLRGSFNYQVEIEHNPWNCDCRAFAYIPYAAHASINFDGLGSECQYPSSVRGYRARTFRENPKSYDLLICNISMSQKCPPKCQCFKQPSKKRVVVNCTATDRTSMPTVVPDEENLEIYLSHNSISTFEYFDYLNRTTTIDLSYNNIVLVDSKVFRLKNIDSVVLHHNKIAHLERTIQQMDPCTIWIGNVTLGECSCDMQWIPTWLEQYKARQCLYQRNVITCYKESQSLDLSLLLKKYLCSIEKSNSINISLVVTVLISLIILVLFYKFRHEVYLYFRKRKFSARKKLERIIHYDAYLSFNAENDTIRLWCGQVLCQYLESQGFKVCLPPRDFTGGGIHVDQIHSNIGSSQSFIVVLSQDFQESQFQNIEWNKIWSIFKSDCSSRISVINYDHMTSKDVTHRKLKAFVRLGYTFNFSNFDNHLLREIVQSLN